MAESTLHAAPDAQTWSAIKILAHAAEFVPYWARQARDVASTSATGAFGRTHEDPARIAAVEEHANDTLQTVAARLERGMAEAEQILSAIPPSGWVRRGRHARRGEMTAAAIVDAFMLDHLEEHRRQLDELLPPSRGGDADAR